MTLPELAQRLNVSRTYVRKLVSHGDIRASVAPDGKVLFDDAGAEAYIAAAEKRSERAMEEYMEASQMQRRQAVFTVGVIWSEQAADANRGQLSARFSFE